MDYVDAKLVAMEAVRQHGRRRTSRKKFRVNPRPDAIVVLVKNGRVAKRDSVSVDFPDYAELGYEFQFEPLELRIVASKTAYWTPSLRSEWEESLPYFDHQELKEATRLYEDTGMWIHNVSIEEFNRSFKSWVKKRVGG